MGFMTRILLCAALAVVTAACGEKIGDSCSINSDCAPEGGRTCDTASPGGYCTVRGCDIGTCPSESECVQFYSVINVDKSCASPADCTIDEICTLGGVCATRASEVRFCMLACSGHGDCRGSYECRDLDRMGAHGGQPVRAVGETNEELQSFCAAALPCTSDAQCDLGDHCDTASKRCLR